MLEPVAHAVQEGELVAVENESAGQVVHAVPERDEPARHEHERVAPLPVQVQNPTAMHVPAPVTDAEPVGHAVQVVRELPANEYVLTAQATQVAL